LPDAFALLAYCFMPDHLHLLVESLTENADLRRFISAAKQMTGYTFSRAAGQRLWQMGFYDHVLRDDEKTVAVVRYILANPIRAGLATAIGGYPFAGSDVLSVQEICECLQSMRVPSAVTTNRSPTTKETAQVDIMAFAFSDPRYFPLIVTGFS
jgi:hypothetical protein